MKNYPGYKEGLNCRGFVSGSRSTPEPKNERRIVENTSEGVGASFAKVCAKATERIQQLREEGDRRAQGLPDEVKPTPRQYAKFRNGYGVAFEFGKK